MPFIGKVDVKGIGKIQKDLDRIQSLNPRLTARALNFAARKINTLTKKEVSAAVGIKQKVIGGRIKIRQAKGGKTFQPFATVTVLLLPVRAALLGKERQTARGARVAGAIFPGAFVSRMKSGHRGIFIRRQSTRPVGPGARTRPRERGALPIDEVTVPINPPFERIARKHVFRSAPVFFRREFERLAGVALQGKAGASFMLMSSLKVPRRS